MPPSLNTRLLDAAWNVDAEMVQHCVERGANVNARDRRSEGQNRTVLHRLLANAGADVSDTLQCLATLSQGGKLKPNLTDHRWQTPATLLFAHPDRDVDALMRLFPPLLALGMTFGSDRSTTFPPAFTCSGFRESTQLLDTLLANGACIDDRNINGDTLITAHLRRLDMNFVTPSWMYTLIERGAEVNAVAGVDQVSALTLMTISLGNNPDNAKHVVRLLEMGADPTHAQRLVNPSSVGGRISHLSPVVINEHSMVGDGYTALHYAAHYGSLAACEALLAFGASPSARTIGPNKPVPLAGPEAGRVPKYKTGDTSPGYTPRELAIAAGFDSVAVILEGAELRSTMAEQSMPMTARSRARL